MFFDNSILSFASSPLRGGSLRWGLSFYDLTLRQKTGGHVTLSYEERELFSDL